MSETLTVGVVGPSHWAYTAEVMAEHLAGVIGARRTKPELLPAVAGVYLNAKNFFKIVLEAAGGTDTSNPCASLANYKIATDTVLDCVRPTLSTSKEVNDRLRRYAAFVDRLNDSCDLEPDDLHEAEEVLSFFNQLARDGEDEDYLEMVRFDNPPLGLCSAF